MRFNFFTLSLCQVPSFTPCIRVLSRLIQHTTLYILLMLICYSLGCDDDTEETAVEANTAGNSMGESMGNTEAGMSEAGMEAGGSMTMAGTDVMCSEDDFTYPVGRMIQFDLPKTAEEATMKGCTLQGRENGSAFGLIPSLAGLENTSALLNPDAEGNINFIIFLQLNPWCSAYTANGVEELDVHVLLGEQTLDTLAISTSSYDENGDPLIRFADGKVNNSTLSTTPELFQLTAGIFGDDPIRVRIEQTSLGGTLDVSEQGVQLSNGYAQGYLSKPALLDFLVDLQNTCLSDNPPEICSLIASVLDNEAEEVLNLFVTLLGGYDTILQADGTATPCPSEDTAECNAMSLCTFVEFEALVLE